MRIGELARRAGVSRDAVRMYEKLGLIRSQRAGNGYRDFTADMLQQLLYVRTAQSLGFSLAEIGAGLTQLLNGKSSAADAHRVLREKITMIEHRISELSSLRKELQARAKLDCPFAIAEERPANRRIANRRR